MTKPYGRNNLLATPGGREISMSRVFKAPRELVFKIATDPKLVSEWWGPAKYKMTVENMELKKGGVWRYVQEGEDGVVFGFNGVYHEVLAPERVIYTFEFEMIPGHVSLEAVYFDEISPTETRIRTVTVFLSPEDRDAMVSSGMEGGATESWDRLEALLADNKYQVVSERKL